MNRPWVHDRMAQARLAGYGWGEIDHHIGSQKLAANAVGYSDEAIRAFLGYKDPIGLLASKGMTYGRNDTTE